MKISRVSRNRISDIVVSRQTVVNNLGGVDKTPATFAVENNTNNNSSNFFLSKEAFYDAMLQKESTGEDSFAKVSHDILNQEGTPNHKDHDEVLAFVKRVIQMHNKAMDHVMDLEKVTKNNGIDKILHVITAHNRPLSNMGIIADRNHHLLLNEDKFLDTIQKSPHHLKLLLDPEKGIIRKVHDVFMEVLS